MDSNRRKQTTKEFQLFKDGKIDYNWPMGYNFLTGHVDIDFPSKNKKVYGDMISVII